MLKYPLLTPIEVNGKTVKELDLKENEDLSGPEFFGMLSETDKAQVDAVGIITGLSTADIHKIKPKDYRGLIEHLGKLSM